MKKLSFFNSKILLVAFLAIFVASCSEDEKNAIDLEQEQTLDKTDLKTILETDNVSGIADNVINNVFINKGTAGKASKETTDTCYDAVYSETGFVLTFNNCVLNGTSDVNGTLTVVYAVGLEESAFTVTYNDFHVGAIKINGSRSMVISSDQMSSTINFNVTSDLTVILEDDTEVIETGTKTVGIAFGQTLEENIFSVEGNWTLKVGADTYSVNVTKALKSNLACSYVSEGTMDVNKNGLAVTVDFGAGECDDKATLTYPDGTEQEIVIEE